MSDKKENETVDEKDLKKNTVIDKVDDKKTVSADKVKSGSNKAFYFIAIIIILSISIAFAFINNRLNKIETEFEQSIIKNNSVVQNNDNRIKEILSRFTSVQQKLEYLESKQEVLSDSLSQPVEQQIHINEDYALAEIEHLLIIASYNLQLDHDVATALSAMEAADTRLTGLSDPAVLSVRKQLIADMNELRSINQADLSGMAFFLSDLINRVDELALKEDVILEKQQVSAETNEEPVTGIKQFLALVFKELKSLVVITRDKDVGKARLLPDEVYFLRANLKLEFANARFSVFNRDTENLGASIGHIQNWLKGYFDLSDADVRNVYDSLSSMKKVDLSFPKIDISSSLESVRALSRYQEDSHVEDEGLDPLQ